MRNRFVAVVALVLPVAATGAQIPAARAIENSATDIPFALTLRKRVSIGGTADGSFTPSVLFPGDVATDARGRLYLLDRAESKVRVYDANGKPLSTIGHRGGGPGEFSEPRQLGVAPDGAVVVSDNGKHAFVRFDAAGKVLPEQSMRGLGTLQRILSTSARAMVLQATINDSAVVLRLADGKVERVATLPPHPTKPNPAWGACGLRGSEDAPLLSAELLAAANQNVVVTNQTSEFSLTIHDPGKPVRILKRARQPERLTMSMAREILGDSQLVYIGSAMRRCAVSTEAIAKEAGLAPVAPPYERLLMDAAGNSWALRRRPINKPHVVDIYAAGGSYRGTATIGSVNPIAFLADGSVISLEKDADDAPIVTVYSIQK